MHAATRKGFFLELFDELADRQGSPEWEAQSAAYRTFWDQTLRRITKRGEDGRPALLDRTELIKYCQTNKSGLRAPLARIYLGGSGFGDPLFTDLPLRYFPQLAATAFFRRHDRAQAEARQQRALRMVADRAAQAQAGVKYEPLIAARWEEKSFYRFPYFTQEFAAELMGSEIDDYPWLSENYELFWAPIIESYPRQPTTESERLANEKKFWEIQARTLSLPRPSDPHELKAKQEIYRHFRIWEKWIFRAYYAATMIKNDSIYTTHLDSDICFELCWDDPVLGEGTLNRTKPSNGVASWLRGELFTPNAHFDKWGEWYFYKVRQAWEELTAAPQAGDGVHGAARPASASEAHAAAAGRGPRRSSIHDQEF